MLLHQLHCKDTPFYQKLAAIFRFSCIFKKNENNTLVLGRILINFVEWKLHGLIVSLLRIDYKKNLGNGI